MQTMEADIIKAYKSAGKRLFLLDYDGTLVEIKRLPQDAKPTPEIKDLLRGLADDPRNTVVIVSGRNYIELQKWLGNLPLFFCAEHGLLYKVPGEEWQATQAVDESWKTAVRRKMKTYAAATPGAFIEEKTNGLVWHYRTAADQRKALAGKEQLVKDLEPLCRDLRLRIMQGAKIVEVQPIGVSKGLGAKHWLDEGGWDFILNAGDDTTDEDMFRVMPADAFTIKVRPGDTSARLRLEAPRDMRKLLRSLL
jgi:trehalose 6-phosphate synthase/phosphatase